MKKYIILMALAAAVVGCSKSEVTTAPGQEVEIAFNPYFGKTPVSKAFSADVDYLKTYDEEATPAFHVNAYLHAKITGTGTDNALTEPDLKKDDAYIISESNIYMDENVWWDVDDTQWAYSGKVYWPDPLSGIQLAFSAYSLNAPVLNAAPTNAADGGILFDTDSYTQFTYFVPQDVAAQEDLLVTPIVANENIEGTSGATHNVSLKFEHLLSRVGFKVKSNNSDSDIRIDIDEVTLHGTFVRSGKVNLMSLAPAIVAVSGSTVSSYTLFPEDEFCSYTASVEAQPIFANAKFDAEGNLISTGKNVDVTGVATTEEEDIDRYMMIIPCNPGDDDETAYIEVHYQLTEAEPQTARVPLSTITFEKGKSYEFIFKISTLAIGVDVEVTDWEDPEVTTTIPLVPDME